MTPQTLFKIKSCKETSLFHLFIYLFVFISVFNNNVFGCRNAAHILTDISNAREIGQATCQLTQDLRRATSHLATSFLQFSSKKSCSKMPPRRRDRTEVSCVIKYLVFGFNVIFWVSVFIKLRVM